MRRPRQMGTKGEKKMYHNNVEPKSRDRSETTGEDKTWLPRQRCRNQTTANGKTVTTLSLATKTSYLKDDERIERTEWHRIQACVSPNTRAPSARELTSASKASSAAGNTRARAPRSARTISSLPQSSTSAPASATPYP